jgi:long-chain fatty acid transport protein
MARRFSFLLVVTVIALMLVSSAIASNGTQIGTVGARSTAMGSNFRGLADDWSAFFFNPAGLTQLGPGKWTVGFSGGLIAPRGGYTPSGLPTSPYSGMYTDKRWLVPQNFFVPAFGIFYKLTEKLTVGAALCAPFGLGAKFDIYHGSAAYGNQTLEADMADAELYSDHMVVNAQAVAAYKLSDMISVGGSVGYIPIGKMKLSQINLPEFMKVKPVLSGLIAILKGAKVWVPDHERLVVNNLLDGDGTAMSASLGLLLKPLKNLSLGYSFRYCTDLKITGTFNQKVHLPGASAAYPVAIKGYFAGIKGAQTLDSLTALGALGLGFNGTTLDTTYDAKANLPLPITFGGGFAYKPFPRLTLVGDITWTRWSKWWTIDVEQTLNGRTKTVSMEELWSNTIEWGLGAEYRAIAGQKMAVDLRAGFYTAASPAPNSTVNPTLLDPSRRYVVTGGFGVSFGKWCFDLAAERVMFANDTPSTLYFYDTANGMPKNYPGKYEINASVVTAGVSVNL